MLLIAVMALCLVVKAQDDPISGAYRAKMANVRLNPYGSGGFNLMSQNATTGQPELIDTGLVPVTELWSKQSVSYFNDTVRGSYSHSVPYYLTGIDATSAVTVTLVSANYSPGQLLVFKVIKGTAAVTFRTSAGLIDGVSGYTMTGSAKYVSLFYDGTNYWKIGSN